MVAAKVELDADLSFRNVARAIDEAEARVRERLPAAVHLYVEPDLPEVPAGSSRPTERAASPPSPSPSA